MWRPYGCVHLASDAFGDYAVGSWNTFPCSLFLLFSLLHSIPGFLVAQPFARNRDKRPLSHRTRMQDQPVLPQPPLSRAGVLMTPKFFIDDARVQEMLWICTEVAYRNTLGSDKGELEGQVAGVDRSFACRIRGERQDQRP